MPRAGQTREIAQLLYIFAAIYTLHTAEPLEAMAPKRKAPAAKKAAPKKKTKAEQAAAASPTEPEPPAQPSRSPQTSKVRCCAPHSCSPCTQAACQHARLRPALPVESQTAQCARTHLMMRL